ncbi:hypothetical protein N658DRAFT_140491 [Parathielavia hyrcaniae]|uniref:Uncharacterized protein n=1 Tax=Parathielavia hyrcaniae TaxID=113614 RepID=A0AAN6Q1U2_9PEZI|nr:hypothetical protein N658DRAFT_140491 [Parathielavia hyrcaniae]
MPFMPMRMSIFGRRETLGHIHFHPLSTQGPRTLRERTEQRRFSILSTLPSTICDIPLLQSMNQKAGKEGQCRPPTHHTHNPAAAAAAAAAVEKHNMQKRHTKTTAIYSYMIPQNPTSTLHLSLSPTNVRVAKPHNTQPAHRSPNQHPSLPFPPAPGPSQRTRSAQPKSH